MTWTIDSSGVVLTLKEVKAEQESNGSRGKQLSSFRHDGQQRPLRDAISKTLSVKDSPKSISSFFIAMLVLEIAQNWRFTFFHPRVSQMYS